MGRYRLPAALLLLLFGCANAAAQGAPPVENTAEAASAEQEPLEDPGGWKFATIGYAWLAGAKGETDVIEVVDPVGLDLSFGDVLKAFEFAFMGAAEARNGRFVILGDLTFIHLDTTKGIDIRDTDFLDAELDSRTAEVTLLGGYRIVDKGPLTAEILAGGRLSYFKADLHLEGPTRTAEGSVKEVWLDPLIAARAEAPLGGKWSLAVYGDVGGILFGSDVTWQGSATVQYQIRRKMSVGAGWRYFKVNYSKGDFLYDVAQSGPIIIFRTDF